MFVHIVGVFDAEFWFLLRCGGHRVIAHVQRRDLGWRRSASLGSGRGHGDSRSPIWIHRAAALVIFVLFLLSVQDPLEVLFDAGSRERQLDECWGRGEKGQILSLVLDYGGRRGLEPVLIVSSPLLGVLQDPPGFIQ